MNSDAKPRRYLAMEANYRQLLDYRPNLAILPWGATEAHNYHLPHGTDVYESIAVAERAATIPFMESIAGQEPRPISMQDLTTVIEATPRSVNESDLARYEKFADTGK